MARKPKLYQKLVRRRGGVGSYSSLWLASDHVLQVEANMMTEQYQRVWFRDVQGFFIRPSREARWVTLTSLGLLVLFVALAFISSAVNAAFDGVAVFSSVMATLCAIVLLYGVLFARSCHFHVVTAVQRSEWGNVARYRQARKLIARLEPLIREAQRDVVPTAQAGADAQSASAGGSPDVSVTT